MLRRAIAFALLFGSLTALSQPVDLAAQTKAPVKGKKSAYPGYTVQKMEGFTLQIEDYMLKQQEEYKGKVKPLEALEQEIKTIIKVMKADYVVKLRNLPIFLNWDTVEPGSPAGAIAFYTPGSDERGNCVVITNMKYITRVHQPDDPNDECVILHEFAHAVDHAINGYQHPQVMKAYQVAMDRKLYGDRGGSGLRAEVYASTNSREYFAELTCAYLDKGRKPIADRDELKVLDAEGYKAMEQVWGKNPERFAMKPRKKDPVSTVEAVKKDEAKKAEAKPIEMPKLDPEKQAADKLKGIQLLIGAGKKDSAKEKLTDLIKQFPDTAAAKKAEELKKTLEK